MRSSCWRFISDVAALHSFYDRIAIHVFWEVIKNMARDLQGKIAAVTGAASGIGWASAQAMLDDGATVVLIDRDEKALEEVSKDYAGRAIPLVLDLLDTAQCSALLSRILERVDHLDIFHANAGSYIGGEFMDTNEAAIDRMLNLNVNVVMKNVHNILPHMIERQTGDIVVTCSVAGHFPVRREPVYASSKWAINCFVQTVRRQVIQHGIRVAEVAPGPVNSALLADWPQDELEQVKAAGGLIEPVDVADAIMFILTRRRGVTIRDVVVLPTNFDM